MIRTHSFILIVVALSFCLNQEIRAQVIGPVTKIQIAGNALILFADTNIVVFKVCTDNILMVNYLPNGIQDPNTLVVAETSWTLIGASIDTSGDPLRITTANYKIEINRNPLRFHLYKRNGQLLCEEPSSGGLQQNSVALTTSGGTFYGVHNRSQGNLPTQNFNIISSGNQGQGGGPFAWTTQGWGFLADVDSGSITIAGTSFSFLRKASSIKRDIELYIFVGSPKEIIKGMYEVTGFSPLFPKYTLGFLNTEWGTDQTELYSDIQTYRKKNIPIDAYILDFDWMDWGADNYGEFRWGPKFPDGQSGVIVDTLKRYGMHLMGIRKPRVHVNTTQGLYCQNHNFFVDYVTDYFSGQQVGRLNFNNPDARQWFWESFALQGNSYTKGITGYWNDEADEYGGNLMFMQMQRGQYEGQRAFSNNRVWSINRNFYTGAQRYAYALWSGDISSGFPSMADQRLFMLSSITLGVSWWGMDIGGFWGTPNSENYFRWIQFGTFVPVFRVHGSLNQEREPWNYGSEAETIATKYIRLRYRLMPYIYSAARENHLTGISIVRPLVVEYPDDPTVANLSSEWMFGNSLLVSPVVIEGATQQSVYLPDGNWYDFNSGKYYAGKTSYIIPVIRSDIPTFVKAGSLIPMSSAAQYVDAPEARKTLLLSSFPGGSGGCTVYDDDGITYDYEKGIFSTDTIIHNRTDQRAIITIGTRFGTFSVPQRDWLAEFNWVTVSPDSVMLDGSRLNVVTLDSIHSFTAKGWVFDSVSQKCFVKFPDNSTAHTLAVYFSKVTSAKLTGDIVPRQFQLMQNYPNPFNPSTVISYQLPVNSHVTFKVYDVVGREVATLVDEQKEAGSYFVQFNASTNASGVYFYKLCAGNFVDTKKMLLTK